MGYHQAGFDVLGIDSVFQPRFPFDFIQRDALDFLHEGLRSPVWNMVDAIHASPPCQRHSRMSNCRPGLADGYPALIEQTREVLERTGLPYVIENVEGAPLREPVTLCAWSFGRDLYRHRLFETNWPLRQPPHRVHVKPSSKAGHWEPGTVMSVAGNCTPVGHAREIMEIDWCRRSELAEAIPPYFTQYVGGQLLDSLK